MQTHSPHQLLDYFVSRQRTTVARLKTMVEMESHSFDKSGVDSFCEFIATMLQGFGAEIQVFEGGSHGNGLIARWRSTGGGAPVMILGHLDTVWPRGTLRDRPFRIDGERAYGPGIFDMKSGIGVCMLVCESFRALDWDPGRDVIFFFSPDEEIGSEAALPQLKSTASGCASVLCLEPSLPGGKVKTFRKGVGGFKVRVQGREAHAGVDHEKGVNAIAELCDLVIRLQALTDYQRGITVNVGTIRGGTAVNVVPAEAEAEMDFRVATVSDGRWIEERVLNLKPRDPRCILKIQGGMNRPPLERTREIVSLYHKARDCAVALGMELGEGATGGGSDGSFTAAMGIPTLDGLGVEGDGAHAVHEHVILDDIPKRAALVANLLAGL